jgi:homospermidine synthase
MPSSTKHAAFTGKLVMLGFGSIGQAMLPLLLRHIDLKPSQIAIVSRSENKLGIAAKMGVEHVAQPLREGNFETLLDVRLGEGDFLLNVSVDVASLSLMKHRWRRGILYLDTCIEPWPGRSEGRWSVGPHFNTGVDSTGLLYVPSDLAPDELVEMHHAVFHG